MLEQIIEFFELLFEKLNAENLFKPLAYSSGLQARKNRNRFYLLLATMFIAFLTITFFLSFANEEIKSDTYDYVIRHRFSSPKPNQDILIVDVDERSISQLSNKYGRWPWPREVLAEVVADIEESRPAAIYLNLILSEKDLSNKNSDNVLQSVLNDSANVILPWVRLNPKNDRLSLVKVSDVPSFKFSKDEHINSSPTIAVIPSIFSDKNDNHGFSNLKEDEDGIIRSFPVRFEVGGGEVSSSALIAAELYKKQTIENVPNEINLNWRNKRGEYKRISFSSLLSQYQGGPQVIDPSLLKNKIIIIGSSAPGIASLKPTSSSNLVDDNEIIATAIDDLIAGSYLHLIPLWADKAISALLIIIFTYGFLYSIEVIDIKLWASEFVLLAITLGFVSYTKYFINFSESIAFSLSFLAVCKAYQSLDDKSSRAEEFFSFSRLDPFINYYSLVVFNESEIKDSKLVRIKHQLENKLGNKYVLILDNIFDGSHLLEKSLNQIKALVIFSKEKVVFQNYRLVFTENSFNSGYIEIPIEKAHFVNSRIPRKNINLNDEELTKRIAKNLLRLSQNLV